MQTNLETVTANRRVFLTAPLLQDIRISGTPFVSLSASADQIDTNVGALLVDWGTDTRVQWNVGDGIRTLTTEDCWGETSAERRSVLLPDGDADRHGRDRADHQGHPRRPEPELADHARGPDPG